MLCTLADTSVKDQGSVDSRNRGASQLASLLRTADFEAEALWGLSDLCRMPYCMEGWGLGGAARSPSDKPGDINVSPPVGSHPDPECHYHRPANG